MRSKTNVASTAGESMYSNSYLMKQHIATSACKLCANRLLSEVSVDAICKEANISRPTFYRYFSNKGELSVWFIETLCVKNFNLVGKGFSFENAVERIAVELPNWGIEVIRGAERTSLKNEVRVSAERALCDDLTHILETRRSQELSDDMRRQLAMFVHVFIDLFATFTYHPAWSGLSASERAQSVMQFVPKEITEAFQS